VRTEVCVFRKTEETAGSTLLTNKLSASDSHMHAHTHTHTHTHDIKL